MSATVASQKVVPVPAYRWTAIFCALAVWGLGLLASSPQLHTALHNDANHLDHTCAVSLFGHGVESATAGTLIASVPALFPAGPCPIQPALPVAEAHYQFPPGCGPPLS